ncbi:Antibiotic biosynthesis monooxygenase (plasmid) [Mycobacterium sp. THAF192]|nr:Antibiotic biosynthesis monooxygenase [Mycobacterium sp. THAF192]
MILEIARITLKPGLDEEFLAVAAEHGAEIFASAVGCAGMQLRKSLEAPDTYIMLVRWHTLDNHLIDFRGSDGFIRWRALTGELYAKPTEIENFEIAFPGRGVDID